MLLPCSIQPMTKTKTSNAGIASHAGVFRGARISSLPMGREQIRAPLKMPAWEANAGSALIQTATGLFQSR